MLRRKRPLPRVFRTQRQLPRHCPHAITPIQNLAAHFYCSAWLGRPNWLHQQRQVGDLPLDFLFRRVDRKRRKSARRKLKRLRTLDLLLNLPYMVKKGLQQWHSGEKDWRRPPGGPGGGSKKLQRWPQPERGGRKTAKIGTSSEVAWRRRLRRCHVDEWEWGLLMNEVAQDLVWKLSGSSHTHTPKRSHHRKTCWNVSPVTTSNQPSRGLHHMT